LRAGRLTYGEVDFDGGDKADGESGDEYVCDDAVVGERDAHATDVLALTVCVQHGSSEQRTVTRNTVTQSHSHQSDSFNSTQLKFIDKRWPNG